MKSRKQIEENAVSVLKANDYGTHTVPSKNMYPHAWLWDSAFISIGLRHLSPQRAATEISTILDGQWQNGMIANMRFARNSLDRFVWASKRSPRAHNTIHTSGISQPPVLAEAIKLVSESLDSRERQKFIESTLGRVVLFHEWIYSERNPNSSGLFAAVHPWESGMENTPPWMEHMKSLEWGIDGRILKKLGSIAHGFRRDTQHTPAHQRANQEEAALFFTSAVKLRNVRYDSERLKNSYPLHVEDIALNSIFVRNNQVLNELADEYHIPLSDNLRENMETTRLSLESLWDENDKLYYSRDAVTKKLIKIPTISSLLPLYTDSSKKERLKGLSIHLQNAETFGLPFGAPTVPANSAYYRPKNYWSAPTWVNTNWLLINGLRRNGFEGIAKRMSEKTLRMVSIGGMHEYFDAKTAEGLGAKDFSWTAALTLDLLRD